MSTTGNSSGRAADGERSGAHERVEPAVALREAHEGQHDAEDGATTSSTVTRPCDRRLERGLRLRALDDLSDDLAVKRLAVR